MKNTLFKKATQSQSAEGFVGIAFLLLMLMLLIGFCAVTKRNEDSPGVAAYHPLLYPGCVLLGCQWLAEQPNGKQKQ